MTILKTFKKATDKMLFFLYMAPLCNLSMYKQVSFLCENVSANLALDNVLLPKNLMKMTNTSIFFLKLLKS